MEDIGIGEDLYESVLKTSQFFTSIVELLPGKFYINQDSESGEYSSTKPGKKKRKKKPDDVKLLAKKAKLLKLDPSQHKTVLELQEEVEKKEKELYRITDENSSTKIKPINVSNVSSTASLEELREKLQAKMVQLRGNRKVLCGYAGNMQFQNQQKKIKAVEKRKNQVESSNIKRVHAAEKDVISEKGIKVDSGEIVYSKFDFVSDAHISKPKKGGKNLKRLLDTAEKKQNNLKSLQETDTEKANELKNKMSWDRAFKKAEGEKLKDNPTLLKKSIKRKEKLKERSSKKWKERVDTVETNKLEKQEKRKQNIKEKREEKSKPGKKKPGKHRKSTPGF